MTVVTGFDRPNLFFRVVKRKGGKETDNSILNYVKRHEDESGIIYCATKKNVDSVCELLLQHGILAGRYHAGLSLEERKESQDDFTYDRIRVMVATNAFGWGSTNPMCVMFSIIICRKALNIITRRREEPGVTGGSGVCAFLFQTGYHDQQTAA